MNGKHRAEKKKDDLLAIIAEHFGVNKRKWHVYTTPLTENTCRYWILFSVPIDRITCKTKPVTTTIILIRPLHGAGVSMLKRPCCRGSEWVIILPSSLTARPCSLPTQYCSTIPERSANTPTDSFSANLLKLQRGPHGRLELRLGRLQEAVDPFCFSVARLLI